MVIRGHTSQRFVIVNLKELTKGHIFCHKYRITSTIHAYGIFAICDIQSVGTLKLTTSSQVILIFGKYYLNVGIEGLTAVTVKKAVFCCAVCFL
jgi:hypothetical protein